MKKTYMIPTLKVVEIQPAQVIATSNMTMQGNYSGEVTIGARGAGFSGYDDEE